MKSIINQNQADPKMNHKANILAISESNGPTVKMFMRYLNELQNNEKINYRFIEINKIMANDIGWCDTIISIRPLSRLDVNIAKIAKKNNKLFISFIDDDFLGIWDDYGFIPDRLNALRKILDYTDLLLACNKALVDKYTALSDIKKFALIDTIVPDNAVKEPFQQGEKLKILYYVNDSQCKMFNKYIMPIIPTLYEKYADDISLAFIAVKPDLNRYEDKLDIRYIGHMSYEDFQNFMLDEHFDVGLAPLDDGGFCQFKYYNKFFEYSIYGIAGVYSEVLPYTYIIKNGENGVYCGNEPGDWLAAIEMFIRDPLLKMKIVTTAQSEIKTRFTVEKQVDRFLEQVPELLTHISEEKPGVFSVVLLQLKHRLFLIKELMYFLTKHVRDEGINNTFRRIKTRLMRSH